MKKTIFFTVAVLLTSGAISKDLSCQLYEPPGEDLKTFFVCDNGLHTLVRYNSRHDISALESASFSGGNSSISEKNKKLNRYNGSDFIKNKNIESILEKYKIPLFSSMDVETFGNAGISNANCKYVEEDTGDRLWCEIPKQRRVHSNFVECTKENEGKYIYAEANWIEEKGGGYTITKCISSEKDDVVSDSQLAASIGKSLGRPDAFKKSGWSYNPTQGVTINIPMAYFTVKSKGRFLIVRVTRSPYTIQVSDLSYAVRAVKEKEEKKKSVDF